MVEVIRIFKSVNHMVVEADKIESGCWISVTNPGNDELQRLSAELHIPLDFLTDPLDIDERARIEYENDCTLVIFRVAIVDKEDPDVPYKTIPAGMIFRNDIIITVCLKNIDEVLDIHSGKLKRFSTENRNRFMLGLLHKSSYFYLKYLDEIEDRTGIIEAMLQKSTKNEELIKLLNLEKSLVYFTTSLKSNELMMERMGHVKHLAFTEDDQDYLEDTLVDHKQAIDVAEIHSNILSGMMDAFASVISNNLNIVMKFLTSITILLMIPTLIASIYGMNIPLPYQHSPQALSLTMGISLLLSLAGIILFLKKKWL